jgi:hypothetical protein
LYGFSVYCGAQQLNSFTAVNSWIVSETVSKKAVELQEAEEAKV